MLDMQTQALAAQIFAEIIGGWSASGRPLPKDGHAEAQLAITYAQSFRLLVQKESESP